MKVIERGHIYQLDNLDGEINNRITFVNRGVINKNKHPGALCQDVLRVNIDCLECVEDRVGELDEEKPWVGNADIIKHIANAKRYMRLALLGFENRARELKIDKEDYKPEKEQLNSKGHFK